MGKENFSKIKLLLIWEMLKQDSDDHCAMSTNQILEKLKAKGIECDRRTLYADIAALNSFGYEVLSSKGQHSNLYYVVDRSFDVPELRILMDAVQAASFVTKKKTTELVGKIAALGGSSRAALLKKNIVTFNTNKHSNESIYYNICNIEEAILLNKKVSFQYFNLDEHGKRKLRKDGARYTVNPVTMVFANDNYYLVCYHDNHDNIANYRIDRMLEVKIEQIEINQAARPKDLDVSKHRQQAFSMFPGKTTNVRFEANRDMIDPIMDKFGEDIMLVCSKEGQISFQAEVQLSNVFFGWCSSFGNRLKIIFPNETVEEYKAYIQEIIEKY